jgi:hypothetical protein
MFLRRRMVDKDSWLYRSGDIWLPKPVVHGLDKYLVGNDRTLLYINYWHGMHFLSGVLFGLFQVYLVSFQHPFYVYFFLHTVWEAWQLTIGMTKQNLRGLLDIAMDTMMGLFGCFLVLQLL